MSFFVKEFNLVIFLTQIEHYKGNNFTSLVKLAHRPQAVYGCYAAVTPQGTDQVHP